VIAGRCDPFARHCVKPSSRGAPLRTARALGEIATHDDKVRLSVSNRLKKRLYGRFVFAACVHVGEVSYSRHRI
jgi:hypothetical protein